MPSEKITGFAVYGVRNVKSLMRDLTNPVLRPFDGLRGRRQARRQVGGLLSPASE